MEPQLVGQAVRKPSEMKFAEAIGTSFFNGNGWENTSLVQSEHLIANEEYCLTQTGVFAI